jgi:hypothetical protein
MSTVITRIMHKLRVGNDAGRITTDDRVANKHGKKVDDNDGFNPYD